MSSRYGVLPYRPEFGGGYSGGGGSLADLILRGGDIQAQAHLERGRIWQDAIGGVGQTIGTAIQQQAEQKKAEAERARLTKQEGAFLNLLQDPEILSDPRKMLMGSVQIYGPEEGIKRANTAANFMSLTGKADEEDQKRFANILEGTKGYSDEAMARFWPILVQNPKMVANAQKLGVDPAQIKPEWDPALRPIVDSMRLAIVGPDKAPEEYTLAPGAQRRRGNELLAENPPEPKPDTRSLELQAAEALASGDMETYNRLLRTRKDLARADDKPAPAPKPVDTAAADRLADAWAAGMAFPSTQDATSSALESFARRGLPVPRKLSVAMQQEVVRQADTLQTIQDVRDAYAKVKGKVGPVDYTLNEWARKIPGFDADPDFVEFNTLLRGMGNLEIKRITGAQVGGPKEAERLLQAMATGTLKPGDFEAALRTMERNAQRGRDIMLYGSAAPRGASPGGAGGGGGAPVRVNSPEEARKLPRGTLFQTPDGRVMRVP